jgi:hypothetical protein
MGVDIAKTPVQAVTPVAESINAWKKVTEMVSKEEIEYNTAIQLKELLKLDDNPMVRLPSLSRALNKAKYIDMIGEDLVRLKTQYPKLATLIEKTEDKLTGFLFYDAPAQDKAKQYLYSSVDRQLLFFNVNYKTKTADTALTFGKKVVSGPKQIPTTFRSGIGEWIIRSNEEVEEKFYTFISNSPTRTYKPFFKSLSDKAYNSYMTGDRNSLFSEIVGAYTHPKYKVGLFPKELESLKIYVVMTLLFRKCVNREQPNLK